MGIRRVGCLVVQNGGAKCTFYKAGNLSNSVGLMGIVLSRRASALGLCFIVSLIWFNKLRIGSQESVFLVLSLTKLIVNQKLSQHAIAMIVVE